MPSAIELRGVRVHNLKNVSVDIPRGKLVAVCGVSGSGKTSLALDTLYCEGQRRYIESFSAYSRQFLARLDKPDCDSINHLPPALAVTRSATYRGNRTTVGTASEVLEYLRIFFAKTAQVYCQSCGQPVLAYTPQTIASTITSWPQARAMIGFRFTWSDAVELALALAELQAAGFVRIIASGRTINIGSIAREELAKLLTDCESGLVIVDRIQTGPPTSISHPIVAKQATPAVTELASDSGSNAQLLRLTESLENAFKHGNGEVVLLVERNAATVDCQSEYAWTTMDVDGASWFLARFSQQLKCSRCDIEFPAASAQLFNFNSPLGACLKCEGFGDTIDLDPNLIVPDASISLRDGAIAPWNSPGYLNFWEEMMAAAKVRRIPVDIAFAKLSEEHVRWIYQGDPDLGYTGIDGFFAWLERKKYKMHVRVFLSRWRSYNPCPTCHGRRLNDGALAYRLCGFNFAQLCAMQIDPLIDMLQNTRLSIAQAEIARNVQEQSLQRLRCLQQVGLGYLTLDRTLRTLSGGEAQRTLLTTALGSSLVNMLYVLDEPSVGLHPHDVERLASAIIQLTDRGNTVVVVEHEDAILKKAELLIEVGPKAGNLGGEIVFTGSPRLSQTAGSLTGAYLSGKKRPLISDHRRESKHNLTIRGCTGNNLKEIDVTIPLGVLCVVCGVSGSGKSSLIQDTLFPAIHNRIHRKSASSLPFKSIEGLETIQDCILIDQSPVSRSPRSNPVTFVKAFDDIRKVFAETIDAKAGNFGPSHFSFNSDLGRCQTCEGDGVIQIDMQFLADVTMTCSACDGNRYRPEVLAVKHRDRNIAEVLRLTVAEAIEFFRGFTSVQSKLKVLVDVGLDYLQLGQSALTLSAGEAQRLKLASYLATAKRPRTLFIFDEPTTGLHPEDIGVLLKCFHRLIEGGHSLIVVEHNLHVIAAADHLIDLGPGAADQGGQVVASGTPESVAQDANSVTGRYLREHLAHIQSP